MNILIVFTCFYVFCHAKNYGLDKYGDEVGTSELRECYGVPCPAGTIGCSKVTKTSSDTKNIMITVQCEDLQGNVLNSETKTSENQYPGTRISSFAFTGQYSYRGGETINIKPKIPKLTNHFNTDYNNNFDKVESFD
ncbi:hypothetical protein FQR65_LT11114 [Abscondita terminalis]|nr:hypothetical protein FQR65_LT11114 [Abscondita terminalis]